MIAILRARAHRFVDLTVKWGTLIGLLFFSEYVVSALLESYRGGEQSLLEIIILLVFFLIYIGLLAFLTLFYPSLQNLLDNMFSARASEADRSTSHEESETMPLSIRLISIFCFMLIIIHAIFPEYAIDNITLALIILILIPGLAPSIIMIIPGLARYLKSIKVGVFEVHFFREEIEHLENVSKRSPEILYGRELQSWILSRGPDEIEPTRQDLLRFDPNLALASLRIDIERKVKQIAKQKDIFINRKSLGAILKKLYHNEVIGSSEYDTLISVIDICNKAVHAERIDKFAASKVLDIGEYALFYLNSIQE